MTHSAQRTAGWFVIATLLALGGCDDDSPPGGAGGSGGTAGHVTGGTAGVSGKGGARGGRGGDTAGADDGGNDVGGDDGKSGNNNRGGTAGNGGHAPGGATGEGAAENVAGEGATGGSSATGGSDAGVGGDATGGSEAGVGGEAGGENLDLCATNNGGCDPVAECTDGHGTRWCVCPPGYRGDGITCTLIDPCPCENGGKCVEYKGNVECDCVPGTSGPTCNVRTAKLVSNGTGSCSLMTDDSLRCWGSLGTPHGAPTFVELSPDGTCGLTASGEAWCWDATLTANPVGTSVTSVQVRGYSRCMLYTDDFVACSNLLGTVPDDFNKLTPPHAAGDTTWVVHPDGWVSVWGETPAPNRPVNDFAAGRGVGALRHSCTIETDGTLMCEGNDAGQASPPPGSFSALALGRRHSCALASDGTAVCWGDDSFGQSSPPPGSFTTLTAGDDHNCGIRSTGLVECWGRNDSGQASPPTATFTRIAAGEAHTCGLRTDKSIQCWGNDDYGQATPPSAVDAHGFNELAVGGKHSCGIDGSTLRCWGDNSRGQMPTPNMYGWIAAGREHTCAVDPLRRVTCWGNGDAGQTTPAFQSLRFTSFALGYGGSFLCGVRTDGTVRCGGSFSVPPPAGAFKSVAPESDRGCGIGIDDNIHCWPAGPEGPLPPSGTFTSLVQGSRYWCGLHPDGSAECWSDTGWDSPMLHPPSEELTELAAGNSFACGVRTDGTVRCWGNERHPGATPPSGVFRAVAYSGQDYCGVRSSGGLYCTDSTAVAAPPPSGPFIDVSMASGTTNTCGRRPDGSLECWGSDAATPPPGRFQAFSLGWSGSSNCAIRDDGTVACWGEASPGAPPAGTYISISMGNQEGVAVQADHEAVSWGTALGADTPPTTPPTDSFLQIDVGGLSNDTCGLRTDATLECWSADVPPSAAASLWVDVPTDTFSSVSVGDGGACALRTDGALVCFWRYGSASGHPTYVFPGQFAAVDTAVDLSIASGCGVRPDGSLECWGQVFR